MNGELRREAEQIQKRFSETWTFDTRDLSRPAAEKVLENLVAQAPNHLAPRLAQEFFGLGPLEPLLNDQTVTEVIANGSSEIWFERNGQWENHPDGFVTFETFKNALDRLCAEAHLTLNLAEPFADGRWRSFRVHLVHSPLANQAFHLTLRRISESPWTLQRLAEAGWASSDQLVRLKAMIEHRKNIIVVGATGSGKTSVLAAALREVPSNERVVVIEDTDELAAPNRASTKLLTRIATPSLRGIDLSELVRQSLRMRPMRLVVGEVRGGEAKDLLLALASGHQGCWGTLHAANARQGLVRLEMLIQMGAPQWNVQAVRQLIQMSVDGLVVCGNANGHRRLEGLYKVAALESFGFLVEQIG